MVVTYTGRKCNVKPKLHAVAFYPLALARIMMPMTEHRTYLKEWRKHRHMTQDQVVNRLISLDDPMLPQTAASLSRLENGKQPYSQRILEALADIYSCEPNQLIGHNPDKEGDIIDLVALLDERKRVQAMAILDALIRSDGTGG